MSKPKTKKYTLTLSESEMRRLSAYAEVNGLARPTALHRIVSQTLREFTWTTACIHDKRQLGLFDSVQIDIFAGTSVVNNNNQQ